MVATPAVKVMIRENKLHNIDNHIQLGAKFGMQTMNQSLAGVVKLGQVAEEDAFTASLDQEDLRKCLM